MFWYTKCIWRHIYVVNSFLSTYPVKVQDSDSFYICLNQQYLSTYAVKFQDKDNKIASTL